MNQFRQTICLAACRSAVALTVLALTASSAFAQQNGKSATASSPAPQIKVDPSETQRVAPFAVSSLAPVVDRVAPSVVTIFTTRTARLNDLRAYPFLDPRRFGPFSGRELRGTQRLPRQQGLGSGVIVTKEGHIITSNHVIDRADEIMVAVGPEQKQFKATRIGTDPGTDIALLKIEGDNFPAVTFADVDKARVGDTVLAIGNPFGVGQSVTSGIISAKSRGGMGIMDYENFIQTDASINPGNSGGALVDTEGRLLGINTAILSRSGGNQGIGFAVPADLVRGVMRSLLETGRVVRGYIGVVVQPITPELGKLFGLKDESGALVTEVTPNSPAAKAGLDRGDVITELNGRNIADPRELRLAVSAMPADANVSLKYLRNVEERTAQLQLEESPNDKGSFAQRGRSGPTSGILGGVAVADITDALRQQYNLPSDVTGAVITSVQPDSPADRAGLSEGDVIRSVDQRPVQSANDVATLSRSLRNRQALVLVWSDGTSRFLVLKMDER